MTLNVDSTMTYWLRNVIQKLKMQQNKLLVIHQVCHSGEKINCLVECAFDKPHLGAI